MSKLIAFILLASCTTATTRPINNFDTLPLPSDSSTLYFNLKSQKDTTPNALDSFVNEWYSQMLFALHEPVLKDYQGTMEIYRFTWLRSFHHPVVVRVEKKGDRVRVTSKVTDGAGGYEPGKIIVDNKFELSQVNIDTINDRLVAAGFWKIKTENDDDRGADGSEWIIEGFKGQKYHVAVRWSPDRGTKFRRIGEYLLSVSGIKNEPAKGDDY
jgi:hypothetical protein